MNQRAEKVVAIEELKDSAPTGDGSGVVLETEAVVDGSLHDTSIEVHHEDVPAVAVALLNTESGVAKADSELPPAIRCLGAGVVHWSSASSIRFHLQFDSGQVLPIEMSKEAALALCRGLFRHTGAADAFEASQWGVGPAGSSPGPKA